MSETRPQDQPSTPEWTDFRSDMVAHRKRLERMLRREMVHDARAARARLRNASARDLADEALCQVLDEWRQKPSGTTPFQWMVKHGLRLLDEALDREALAADSRDEERAEESRIFAHDLTQDDEERWRWFEMAGRTATSSDDGAPPPITDPTEARDHFDGLESPPDTSSPEERLQQRETLVELERALLALPEARRRAIAHRFLDGLEMSEICYLLDADEEHVETEIRAGLATLRQTLGH